MEEVVLDMVDLELKQSNLEKASENFYSRCNKVDGQFKSTRNSLDSQFRELKAREEAIVLQEKQLKEKEACFESMREAKEKELGLIEEIITKKRKKIEQVESELEHVSLLLEEKCQELNSKEKRFLEVEKFVKENERECDLIKKRVEDGMANLRRIEKFIGKVDVNHTIREHHLLANRVKCYLIEAQKKMRELELKETQVEAKVEELGLIDIQLSERLNEVELKEKHFDLWEKSMQEEKQYLVSFLKTTEERGKDLDSLSDELDREIRELYHHAKDLESKSLFTEESEHAPWASNQGIHLSGNNGRPEGPHLKRMKEDIVQKKAEKLKSSLATCSATPLLSNVQPYVSSDKRNVPGVLEDNMSGNDRNDSTQNELAASLRFVADPAELVLNSMQLSLARYLRNGDFEESIMSSNIFILKELMIVSPLVGSHLKADSTTLATQWKEKMRGNTVNAEEGLAFLLFLAMYGLVSMLNADEIVQLLGLVSQNKRALEFCHAHGFAAKITDFIRKLIEKKLLMEAVRSICALKLCDKLPPVPLLNEYVEDLMRCSKLICRSHMIATEKVNAVNGKLAELRAVIQCIKDYNLESVFPSKTVEMQIVQLETLMAKWRSSAPSLVPKVEQETKKRHKPCTSSPAPKSRPEKKPEIRVVFKRSRS